MRVLACAYLLGDGRRSRGKGTGRRSGRPRVIKEVRGPGAFGFGGAASGLGGGGDPVRLEVHRRVVGLVATQVGRDERAPDGDRKATADHVGEDALGELAADALALVVGVDLGVEQLDRTVADAVLAEPDDLRADPGLEAFALRRVDDRDLAGRGWGRQSASSGSTRSARCRTSSRVPAMLWTRRP